ncbi:Na+:solute symporter [Oceanobacillus piezotolerans]|uniref:Na+:solute symporter n=1 Tax=Oceanobacillus piezotolerans TaxID=2448030 RepID=A0A498D5P3_9BACI|nr:sodium:solute symporter family protein [Oceanobacillus piezotolerans]RLL41805.1 Na+:solute symporter [Oceanobacillus piezotolerans]
MHTLDWVVVGLFFLVMIGIGIYSYKKNHSSDDFFVGGGKVPWWLSGVSHHVSGHSGVVFVAYAGIAYTYGITIYFWWAVAIGLALLVTAKWVAPRWPRLREKLGIQSPTEYMAIRFGLPAQQVTAWTGVLIKLLDIGAKWASMGILLSGFTGLPIWTGIILSGIVSLIYVAIGGLWADLVTDFVQFLVQLIAGIVIFVGVFSYLGGPSSLITMWGDLPDGHASPFNGSYTPLWIFLFIIVKFFDYSGGNWNLAARFISTPNGEDAKKAARLSAVLYFVWPLLIFLPMVAAPLIFPDLTDPAQQLYPMLTTTFMPAGLVGLVLAALFASTMGMTVSDINALTAVVQRDILPVMNKKFKDIKNDTGRQSLIIARLLTILFTILTITVGLNQEQFGGVIGLIITWFSALVGPMAVPLIFGQFSKFKYSNGPVAIISILSGVAGFAVTQLTNIIPADIATAFPLLVTLAVFFLGGYINKKRGLEVSPEIDELLDYLKDGKDHTVTEGKKTVNM